MIISRAAAIGLLFLTTSVAAAQRPNRQMAGRPGRGQDQRAQLEDDVRREFGRIVRQRVGLNDEQMQKLGPLTQKYEQQRRQTQMDERNTRIRLQAALLDENAADSAKVNLYVQQLMDVQRRRLAIAEAEQKELGTIMTAHQRAKYLGLQEQVRRRLEQMRPGPGGGPDDMPAGRPGRPDAEFGDRPSDSVTVRVSATPTTTRIVVDGVEQGLGRKAIRTTVGPHRVALSAPGCKAEDFVVNVTNDPNQLVTKALTCQ